MTTLTKPIECCDVATDTSLTRGGITRLVTFLGGRLKPIAHWLQIYRQNRRNRLAFRSVLRLDDRMLRDIGLTREDVIWANNLPLSQNAAQELNNITLGKRLVAS